MSTIFERLGLTYSSSNLWKKIPKQKRNFNRMRKQRIEGVEIKLAPEDHILKNEYCLYASKNFCKYDIIGEYTGEICYNNGKYVASIGTDIDNNYFGVDAEQIGNELRFINDYHSIKEEPNVIMSICYVDTYPHIMIVCCNNIANGDEILLDYGEAYYKCYIQKHDNTI